MKTLSFIFCVAVFLTLLTSCYESPDVTYYSPGEYKGKPDPLLAKERKPEQKQILVERFNEVQTDR